MKLKANRPNLPRQLFNIRRVSLC